jgi:hypothetical protein
LQTKHQKSECYFCEKFSHIYKRERENSTKNTTKSLNIILFFEELKKQEKKQNKN